MRCFVFICSHHDVLPHPRPKHNGVNRSWAGTSKYVSQNIFFSLYKLVFLGVCQSNRKLPHKLKKSDQPHCSTSLTWMSEFGAISKQFGAVYKMLSCRLFRQEPDTMHYSIPWLQGTALKPSKQLLKFFYQLEVKEKNVLRGMARLAGPPHPVFIPYPFVLLMREKN